MTAQLATPGTDYLLSTALDALHSESKSWNQEIDLWKDEMQFFQSLIRRRKIEHPDHRKQDSLLDHLVRMNKLMVQDLDKAIIGHEKDLERLYQEGERSDDQTYRETHYKLSERFHNFKRDYLELKRKIFELEK
jgi:hypothetical protein